MKRLLEFLFSGCFHEWEVYETKSLYNGDSATNKVLLLRKEQPIPCGTMYVLRCKKCGNMKKYSTY